MCFNNYDNWKTAEDPAVANTEALIEELSARAEKNGTTLEIEIEKYNNYENVADEYENLFADENEELSHLIGDENILQ